MLTFQSGKDPQLNPVLRNSKNKKIIAITIGDPGGVGPEVILKSFRDIKKRLTKKQLVNTFFVCIGSYSVLLKWKKWIRSGVKLHAFKNLEKAQLKADFLNILDISNGNGKFSVGKLSKSNGKLALDAIRFAANLAKNKKVDAVVTAPVNKTACQRIDPHFMGHTDILARIDGAKKYAMMMSGGPLRVILETVHIPIHRVPKAIRKKSIQEKIELAHQFSRKYLGMRRPRIGVCGLNPHAGESGSIGKEEIQVIRPAIIQSRKKGIRVSGPYAPDTIFHEAYQGNLDCIIAMYHDQGLSPLKMIAFDSGVNTTLGLSFIRTSPDHGTAFDIAGKNKASSRSMTQAILDAVRMVAVP